MSADATTQPWSQHTKHAQQWSYQKGVGTSQKQRKEYWQVYDDYYDYNYCQRNRGISCEPGDYNICAECRK